MTAESDSVIARGAGFPFCVASYDRIDDRELGLVFDDAADSVRSVFRSGREAAAKGLSVFGTLQLLDELTWPEDFAFYEDQLVRLGSSELLQPTRAVVERIDVEKIDAFQQACQAMQILEELRERLAPRAFLLLEDSFQRLKIVCLLCRRLASAYFSLRAIQTGGGWPTVATLIGRVRDFREAVSDHKAVAAGLGSDDLRGNYRRVQCLQACLEGAVERVTGS